MIFLAIRYLMERKRQTILTLLGVFFGTMAFVAVSGSSLAFRAISSSSSSITALRFTSKPGRTIFPITIWIHFFLVRTTFTPFGHRLPPESKDTSMCKVHRPGTSA